jgi:hypothetical protein
MLVSQYICMESCIINCNSFSTSFSVIWNNLDSVHCEISRLCWSFFHCIFPKFTQLLSCRGPRRSTKLNLRTCPHAQKRWRTTVVVCANLYLHPSTHVHGVVLRYRDHVTCSLPLHERSVITLATRITEKKKLICCVSTVGAVESSRP